MGQGEADVCRGDDGVLRHVHGSHQVVDVEEGVQLLHSLRGDDLTGDPHHPAGEHAHTRGGGRGGARHLWLQKAGLGVGGNPATPPRLPCHSLKPGGYALQGDEPVLRLS